jgi:hypothetical protein
VQVQMHLLRALDRRPRLRERSSRPRQLGEHTRAWRGPRPTGGAALAPDKQPPVPAAPRPTITLAATRSSPATAGGGLGAGRTQTRQANLSRDPSRQIWYRCPCLVARLTTPMGPRGVPATPAYACRPAAGQHGCARDGWDGRRAFAQVNGWDGGVSRGRVHRAPAAASTSARRQPLAWPPLSLTLTLGDTGRPALGQDCISGGAVRSALVR